MGSLVSLFVASLLGSAHCVGMCGGIVLLYSQESERRSLSHIAYNTGRLSSYILLGAIAGALGQTVNLAGTAAGIGHVAAILFGLLMIIWGITLLFKGTMPEPALIGTSWITKLYHTVGKKEIELPLTLRAYLLGLLSTLLPCGWLYLFAAVAAASGDVLSGIFIMAIFWLGTLPYLLSVGLASQHLLGPLRQRLPVITAVLVILAGVLSVSQHLGAFDMVSVLSGK